MRSRLWPFLQVALVALVFVVVPACSPNGRSTPPTIVAVLPAVGATTDLGIMPNIIIKFDRAMTDSLANNSAYYNLIPAGGGGIPISVQHLPALNEVRIIPNALLLVNTVYTVVVSGQLTSTDGTPMGANIGFAFDTINSSNLTGNIAFNAPTAVGGALAGQITLTWTKATEPVTGPGTVDITIYNIYASTTQGGADLMLAPTMISNSLTGDTITGLTAGTVYYIKVQPVDGNGNVFTNLVEVTATATP